MTRSDFIHSYSHNNLFTVTPTAQVRADSVPMQRAFRAICSEAGFQEHLQATLKRIGEIESLVRTREIVLGQLGRKYRVARNSGGIKLDSRVTELEPRCSKTNE
jgi:hypothetical protein